MKVLVTYAMILNDDLIVTTLIHTLIAIEGGRLQWPYICDGNVMITCLFFVCLFILQFEIEYQYQSVSIAISITVAITIAIPFAYAFTVDTKLYLK